MFGLVLKKKRIREEQGEEFYFVIEIKGTNELEDKKALTESEAYKIKCALTHFAALGVEASYKAPVKDYATFEKLAK